MLRAFVKAPGGVIGLAAIGLILLAAIVAPELWHAKATGVDVLAINQGPSPRHLLGTDQLGRDVFFRVLVATRTSLGFSLAATAIGAILGISAGVTASALPGAAKTVALRTIDILLAFPGILVAIFISVIVGTGATGATLGVGVAGSFFFARVASSLALAMAGQEFIAAARVVGVRRRALMFRYVLPNVAEPLIIATTVSISNAIVQVSSLSFLGLGIQPPSFDWGRMLTTGVQGIYLTPAAALGPAAAIAITALAFGFTGEAIARVMNPRLWAVIGATGSPAAIEDLATHAFADDGAAAAADGREPASTGVPPPVKSQSAVHDEPVANGSADIALAVQDLVVEFPNGRTPLKVVDGVSFSLRRGEVLGLVGESGSGKTMTAMAIAQLIPYPGTVSGAIALGDHDLLGLSKQELDKTLGSQLAIVFQNPMSAMNPALRIGTQLTEGVRAHRRLSRRAAVALAEARLHEVNIPTPAQQMRRRPHELSGGMRQRAMIAMGLVEEPSVLIADEPTTALDVTIQAQIMDVLDRVHEDHNTAVVLISHNLALVSQNCDRVVVMYAGRIVEDLTIDQLHHRPLHPYTRALHAAVPDPGQAREQPLATIPGQVPDMASRPRGCAFNPRCPLAVEKCVVRRPPLLQQPDGQRVACWVTGGDVA